MPVPRRKFPDSPWSLPGAVGTTFSEKDLKFLRGKTRLTDDERRVLALDDAEVEMKASIEEQRHAQARREAGEEEEIRVDRRLVRYEQAKTILAAIEKVGPTLKWTENLDPRDKHGDPPQVFDATFKTDLGHYGTPRKPRVLVVVGSPRISRCGALHEYPGQREFRHLYETAWELFDTDKFEIEGSVSCSFPLHHPHRGIARFDGFRMADFGIEGRGPQPAPEPPEPRPVAQVKPRPSAEEILREAVRADAR